MRWISSLAVIAFVAGVQAAEPEADSLAELRWLVGEWRGVGQGDPGTSGSERHIEFDTLGFVGTYVLDKAASGPDRWVLVAESLENVPKGWKARYVFTRKSDDEYHEMLELDPDGKGFQPYVTNRFLRVTS